MTIRSAHTVGTEKSRPSIREVAALAGVSPGCVSNVLNHRRRQDDPIGRAVLAAVADLGYRANSMAANLRRVNSRFIGVVLPDFENPFFGALLSSLERCAEESGYRLTAATSRDDPTIEAREVEELLGWRVAGLLIAPTMGSLPDAFADAGVPMVVVDRVAGSSGSDEVSVNNEAAAFEVTSRLIALGHRHILIAFSDPLVLNMAERIKGVELAITASGQPVTLERLHCGWTVESADIAFEAHLTGKVAATAMFTLHNLATLAAFGAVLRRGLVPGRNLALVSFDDSAWMAHMHPAVAAVAQPVDAIARTAWKRLLVRIEGADGPPEILRIPCQLFERGTFTPP